MIRNAKNESVMNKPTMNEPTMNKRAMDKRGITFSVSGIKYYENEYYKNSPNSFAAVSLTGADCACRCAHCEGHILKSMKDVSDTGKFISFIDKAVVAGLGGLLISGGADSSGSVPILPRIDEIAYAKRKGLRIVVHTGLIDPQTARALKSAGADRVSFDVIGSAKTIRDVYGIDKTPDDYYDSMINCLEVNLPMTPHIVVGLDFGKIEGEFEAVDMIRRVGARNLVFVVFVPKRGTRMENAPAPLLTEVIGVFEYAARTLRNARLALGCARPASYSVELEKAALDLGFDAIAYPHERTIKRVREEGLEAVFMEECCCLQSD